MILSPDNVKEKVSEINQITNKVGTKTQAETESVQPMIL